MENRLTCGNHIEIVLLIPVGRTGMAFTCPECGDNYTIGRKIATEEMKVQVGK